MKKRIFICITVCALLLTSLCSCGKSNDIIYTAEQLDSPEYTITVIPESETANIVLALYPNAKITYSVSDAEAYYAVKNGKADAFIYDKYAIAFSVTAEAISDLTVMDESAGTVDIAMAISPNTLDLLDKINEFIALAKSDGTFDDMDARWFAQGDKVQPEIELDNKTGRVLTVATCGTVEPYSYVIENGEIIGYDVELAYRLAQYLGCGVEVITATFDAMTSAIQTDRINLIISNLNVTEQRCAVMTYSDVYDTLDVGICVRSDRYAKTAQTETEEKTSFIESVFGSFKRTFVVENRWKLFCDGFLVTAALSLASAVLGTALGFAFSFPLRSKNRVINKISNTVSLLLDGMPTVVILLVLYYIILGKTQVSAFAVGVIGLSLGFGNNVAGMLNMGVSTVSRGQISAATALGYKNGMIFRRIVLPQAVNKIFGQYMSSIVGLVKETAIVGYITVEDLTRISDIVRGRTYEAFFPLISTALIYFGLARLIILGLKLMGSRIEPKKRKNILKGVKTK